MATALVAAALGALVALAVHGPATTVAGSVLAGPVGFSDAGEHKPRP